jgi:hypothetical protein
MHDRIACHQCAREANEQAAAHFLTQPVREAPRSNAPSPSHRSADKAKNLSERSPETRPADTPIPGKPDTAPFEAILPIPVQFDVGQPRSPSRHTSGTAPSAKPPQAPTPPASPAYAPSIGRQTPIPDKADTAPFEAAPQMIEAGEGVLRAELGGLHDGAYWSPGFAASIYRAMESVRDLKAMTDTELRPFFNEWMRRKMSRRRAKQKELP